MHVQSSLSLVTQGVPAMTLDSDVGPVFALL